MNIKKILVLLLLVVMSLSMAACGSSNNPSTATEQTELTNTAPESTEQTEQTETDDRESAETDTPSLEDLLSSAIELDGYSFFQEYQSNKVKLSSQYVGTSCLVNGYVDSIESDYLSVSDSNLKIHIYLPTEEIIKYDRNQYVQIVGILENIGFEQKMSNVWVTGDFHTGYVSTSTYEKTGVYHNYTSTDGTHPEGTCLEGINNIGKTIFYELELTDEQKQALTNGQELTVEARMFLNENDRPYSAYLKLEVKTLK